MINNIQALRAFAAINVVLFHIIETSSSYSQSVEVLKILHGWGANGVDIFFVISGFVMLHTQTLKRRPPYQFLKHRLIRIAPLYWAITLFVLFLHLALPSIFRGLTLTSEWVLSSFLFVSSCFFNQGPIVYAGWTLEWEMFFYVAFACGLFFDSRRLQVFFVVLSITLVSAFSGNFIATEFLFGMLVAYIYRAFSLSIAQGMFTLAAGVILLLLSISSKVASLELNRVLIWGLPSFFIVCGALYSPQVKGRLFSYLGDASYSIYLIQMLTIPAFYKASSRMLSNWNGDVVAIGCLVASVAFGCLVHSWLERPITAKLRGLLAS